MIKEIVHSRIELSVLVCSHVRGIAGAIRASGQVLPIEQSLGPNIKRPVSAGIVAKGHRTDVIRNRLSAEGVRSRVGNYPTCEDTGKIRNLSLPVGWYPV